MQLVEYIPLFACIVESSIALSFLLKIIEKLKYTYQTINKTHTHVKADEQTGKEKLV